MDSIESVMARASVADRAKFAAQLRQYLAQKCESIRAATPGVNLKTIRL